MLTQWYKEMSVHGVDQSDFLMIWVLLSFDVLHCYIILSYREEHVYLLYYLLLCVLRAPIGSYDMLHVLSTEQVSFLICQRI